MAWTTGRKRRMERPLAGGLEDDGLSQLKEDLVPRLGAWPEKRGPS